MCASSCVRSQRSVQGPTISLSTFSSNPSEWNRIIMLRALILLACSLLVASKGAAFVPHPNHRQAATGGVARGHADIDSRMFNFFENIGSMISNFGKKATASHILIGPKTMNQNESRKKLEEIKAAVGNDPAKFAQYAAEFSTCPSAKKGGDLGAFGPGMMVKNFDRVCFEEEVGVVHGPVSTQFGEHLIYIADRTGE